jgi:CxxC motif-containing protein (DUF1111 family)
MKTALSVGGIAALAGLLWADPRMPGGETTVFDDSREAFAQPAENLDPRSLAQFFSGDTIFNTNWVNVTSVVQGRDGLGPLFNTRSCSSCHFKDGRGEPPKPGEISNGLLVRLSIPGRNENGGPLPHPIYGNQLSVRALPSLEPEASVAVDYQEIEGSYPDGTIYRIQKPTYKIETWAYGDPGPELLSSPRVAPSVFGLGLLESIPEKRLLERADPKDQDRDGISGRVNRVWSLSEGKRVIGRFGWKANKATLQDQVAGAFQGDIGITSILTRTENHTLAQTAAARLPSGGNPELAPRDLEDTVFYMGALAPPIARFENDETYSEGLRLFESLQCASCHTPKHVTRSDASIPALASQTIYPYTDLLLHDMGEALADGRPDFEASGSEWRTPPLWGIGLIPTVNGHSRLLHDGRARSIEEAILWHGGEASNSKDAFMRLSSEEREKLIRFVESL